MLESRVFSAFAEMGVTALRLWMAITLVDHSPTLLCVLLSWDAGGQAGLLHSGSLSDSGPTCEGGLCPTFASPR